MSEEHTDAGPVVEVDAPPPQYSPSSSYPYNHNNTNSGALVGGDEETRIKEVTPPSGASEPV